MQLQHPHLTHAPQLSFVLEYTNMYRLSIARRECVIGNIGVFFEGVWHTSIAGGLGQGTQILPRLMDGWMESNMCAESHAAGFSSITKCM